MKLSSAGACLWLLCCLSVTDSMASSISLNGLFGDKAVVGINGKQRILSKSKPSPEGARLISIKGNKAVIEYQGKTATYRLGAGGKTTHFAKPVSRDKVVRLERTRSGMFTLTGLINGKSANMMVDTGASTVAMNSHQADALGIRYLRDGQRGRVSTANGITVAWFLTLRSVTVGSITLRDVDAAVTEGGFPETVLLGMSFLGRVKMEHQQGVLLIKSH